MNQLRGLTDDVLSGHLGFVEDGDDLLHVLAGAVLPTGERMRMPSEPNRNSGVTRNSNREKRWCLGPGGTYAFPVAAHEELPGSHWSSCACARGVAAAMETLDFGW